MNNKNIIGIKRSDQAVWRVIDGDIVVLLPEDGMLHALGGCGTRIWELIEEETTFSEVLDTICEECTVEPVIAEGDISDFIESLSRLNLVEITTGKREGSI